MTLPAGRYLVQGHPVRRPIAFDAALGDGHDHLLLYAAQHGLLSPMHGAGFRGQVRVIFAVPSLAEDQSEPSTAAGAREPTPPAAAFRALFQEPGLWRVIRFGDFRPMIEAQLEHPDRIRDAHRLPCYVQVYEITQPAAQAAVTASILGERAREGTVRPLSDADEHALGIAGLSRVSPAGSRSPGQLLPNDKLLRLTVAMDPTVDDRLPSIGAPDRVEAAAVLKEFADKRGASPASEAPRVIPERYQRPWECVLSREEALCDVTASETLGITTPLWRRVVGALTRGRAMRQWRDRLRGRSFDEQLWTARPPKDAFARPEVREWARRTLALGGYDATHMLAEWEIFWRQRGV